jgi:HD-like signal output (HDOD) protein
VNPRPLRILLVDDDGSVLEGLRHVLRAERHRWDIRATDGAAGALAALAREPADVVVTDMRMPGMDGVDLLGRVHAEWPGTVRVLLSGWADLASITRAGTVAHRYLLKPCDAETLRGELAGIQEIRARLPDPRLQASLGALRSLPSSPETPRLLERLPENRDERSRALAAAVESDVALTARILQFVSSPSFGSPRPITGIRDALGLLGPALIREIAAQLEPLASSSLLPGAADSLLRLERHAATAARMARSVAPDESMADPAATAALLHDAGRLVLLSRLPGPYAESLQLAARTSCPLVEAERELLGASHAEIGAYVLGLWGLPASLVDAVARHHDPGVLDDETLAGLVATANLLAHQAEAAERTAPGAALARSIR